MRSDVVVVGGGAIGVSVALELARHGERPLLLERGDRLAAGCSAGSAGLICPSHSAPLATPAALRQGLRWALKPDSPLRIRPRPALLPWLAAFARASTAARAAAATDLVRELSLASLEQHAALAEEGLDIGFEQRGVMNVYETEAAYAAGRAEAAHSEQVGNPTRVLTADEARELEPALSGSIVGAVLYPEEAHCDPLRFVEAVGRAAADAGAEIRTGVEVLSLRRRNGRVEALDTTAGEIRPGRIVLATGAWTPMLARDLGISVPVEAGKGYHVDLEAQPGDPRIPVFMQESRVIATPLEGRLRLAGTLELCGLDLSVDRRRVDAIVAAAERNLGGSGSRKVVEVWRGLRPCAPDGLPILGRAPGLDNVVLATGHAMMGLTLAPVTGRLVAELLAGERPSHDLTLLRPDRFRSLGVASRRRRSPSQAAATA
jgi:D-amino-acid dehydrogenase